MVSILEAHSVGEKALLITGYQGVGKNKIVDYILKQINCEREVSCIQIVCQFRMPLQILFELYSSIYNFIETLQFNRCC